MSDTNARAGRREPTAAVRTAAWAGRASSEVGRPSGTPNADGNGKYAMVRVGAFFAASWLAAAVLYFGRHSVALIVLSGVVALGGLDLVRPD